MSRFTIGQRVHVTRQKATKNTRRPPHVELDRFDHYLAEVLNVIDDKVQVLDLDHSDVYVKYIFWIDLSAGEFQITPANPE